MTGMQRSRWTADRAAHRRLLPFVVVLLAWAPVQAAQPDDLRALERDARRASVTGHFSEALAGWADAERILAGQGDEVGLARVLIAKSAVYAALGRLPDALDAAGRARELARSQADSALLAAALAALGSARLTSGLAAPAESALREALALAEQMDLPAVNAAARNDLATLAAARGRHAEAAAGFAEAARVAARAGDAELAAAAAVNRARSLVDSGDTSSVREAFADAERRLSASPPGHRKAFGQVGLGQLHRRAGFESEAERTLHAAADTARTVGDARALSFARGYLGALLEERGQIPEALEATRDAVLAAQRVDAPEILYRWQWQSARLLRAGGATDTALGAYRRAVATLQRVRPDLDRGVVGPGATFRERVGPLYLQLADLQLRAAAVEHDPTHRQARLREARATVEMLKGAELADYFQDDCVAQFRARTVGVDRLAPRTAAVYPILMPDRTDVLLSLPDGLRLVRVPVGAEAIAREVHAFRQLLVKRTTHEYLRHARQLYDWLIRPLEAHLAAQDVETLVLIPDGPLRTVPVAALHDGTGFLTERYAVATSPGLTLTDPHPIPRDDLRLLAIALSDPVQGFPPLPDVDTELGAIVELYGGTVLRNDDFLVPSVERELTEKIYSVVHVASHAQFDGDLSKTFLLTYESRLTMDALGTLIGTTAFRDEPVELLALSACQTAAGDDRAALGLAGVAVKSGARSALATLWFINDRASSVLVSKFYRHLKSPGISKAEALRRAQRELLEDRVYRHPAYWSPFLMIGNWL